MGKTKKIEITPRKANKKPGKKEYKSQIKLGVNPAAEKEARLTAYKERINKITLSAKEKSIKLGKIIFKALSSVASKKEEVKFFEDANSEEITAYAVKNKCSRSTARKRMNKERRGKTINGMKKAA